MAKALRFASRFMPDGVGAFDAVAPDRTDLPTAAILVAVKASAAITDGAAFSVAVTDFTTTAMLTGFCGHGYGTSTAGREHITPTPASFTSGIRLLDATDGAPPFTPLKVGNFQRQAGGIRVQNSLGGAHALHTALFFEGNWRVVNSTGDGDWSAGEVIALAHTLNNPATLGVVFSNNEFNEANTHMNLSVGMFRDAGVFDEDTQEWIPSLSQQCATWRWRDAQAAESVGGQILSNVVAAFTNNSGGSFSSQAVTDNDVNLIQITNQDGGATGSGFVGLVSDLSSAEFDIDIIDLPTSAGDWEYDGVAFTPSAFFGLMTQMTSVGSGSTGAHAGAFTFAGWSNDGSVMSLGCSAEHGADPTNTSSHANITAIQHRDDEGTITHQIDDLTFTSDGWDVLAADLTATGAAKMLALIIGDPAGTSPNAISQVGEIEGLAVLFDNEIDASVYGSAFGETGNVYLSDYDIGAGETPGTSVEQDQIAYADNQVRFDVNLGALSAGNLYLTVTPTGGDASTVPVTVNADPGASSVGRRTNPVALNATEGQAITSLDFSDYFFKVDAQDFVTYTSENLPPGITRTGAIISGTITDDTGSPFDTFYTCTDSYGNFSADSFLWTVTDPDTGGGGGGTDPPVITPRPPTTPKQRIYRFRVPKDQNRFKV